MLNTLASLSARRLPWLLLAISALMLELVALYFQYVRNLDPCVLCVYERLAVLGILAAGLLGAVAPRLAVLRWVALVTWAVAAAWGLYLAAKHVGIQFGQTIDLSCSYFAEFPAWAQLDQWLPSVFMPTGFCDEVQWVFLGLSMPQWMLAVFALYLAVALLVAGSRLARRNATG